MTCACCNSKEADKDNTHFLTDAIIKTALNLDGGKQRETGLYFDLSNDGPFVDFNFQRNTSIAKLETLLGRRPTENEITKAMSNPFSVDKVFCTDCEKLFTAIETRFTRDYLPLFRERNLNGIDEVQIADITAVRLFFFLQIFRTAICDPHVFYLPEAIIEQLRSFITGQEKLDIGELKQFPLSVTYLQTLGGPAAYTSNQVGYSEGMNPSLIFMNDFVIQFYFDVDAVRFFDYFNLNSVHTYRRFTNYEEDVFLIRILSDKARQWLNHSLREQKADRSRDFYIKAFLAKWYNDHGRLPAYAVVNAFLKSVIGNDEMGIVKYTANNFEHRLGNFIRPFNR